MSFFSEFLLEYHFVVLFLRFAGSRFRQELLRKKHN